VAGVTKTVSILAKTQSMQGCSGCTLAEQFLSVGLQSVEALAPKVAYLRQNTGFPALIYPQVLRRQPKSGAITPTS
jgi:hypothetical protein